LHAGCRPGRNHAYQFLWRSVKGFWCGEGSNFGLFHWLASSPLKHSRTTVRVCDVKHLKTHLFNRSFPRARAVICWARWSFYLLTHVLFTLFIYFILLCLAVEPPSHYISRICVSPQLSPMDRALTSCNCINMAFRRAACSIIERPTGRRMNACKRHCRRT